MTAALSGAAVFYGSLRVAAAETCSPLFLLTRFHFTTCEQLSIRPPMCVDEVAGAFRAGPDALAVGAVEAGT